MVEPSRPSRRPAALLLAVGLAWLVAAAAATVAAGSGAGGLDAAGWARFAAALVLRLAPPLAVVLIAVELLRRTGRDDAEVLAELDARTAAAAAAGQVVRDGLLDIDATLAAIGGRLEALHRAAADDLPRLAEAGRTIGGASETLTTAGEAAARAMQSVVGALPAAQRQAEALTALLTAAATETARQLGEVETLLAGVYTRQDEVAAQVRAIASATKAANAAIDDRTGALEQAVDAALARTATALAEVRDGVEAQGKAMLASLDAARIGLEAIGGETTATVAARVDHIVAATGALGAGLAESDARTAALIATVERSFTVLDKRLGHAAAMGTATLDAFQARITSVRDTADAVAPRLDTARASLVEVEAAAARLVPAAGAAEGLAQALAAAGPPAARLAGDLAAAQAALGAVEEAAHGSTLAAANQLIEVLARVREVAGNAAGTLRATLAEVVAEAETALTDAGARTAAAAFADPIRREIAGLEGAADLAGQAAQATADRIAARLLGLTQAVATVERRLAEVER